MYGSVNSPAPALLSYGGSVGGEWGKIGAMRRKGGGDRKAQQRRQRSRVKAFMRSLKDAPCLDCGVRYPPCVMDWDHVGPKTSNINRLARARSSASLMRELAHCELV